MQPTHRALMAAGLIGGLVLVSSCAPEQGPATQPETDPIEPTAAETPPTETEDPTESPEECRQLDASLEWADGVREQLQTVIDENSVCAGTWDGDRAPVAIFDWDNTVVKNDVGYGLNYWMLLNDKVLQPEDQDWRTINPFITDAAADALLEACGTDVAPGDPLPTSTNNDCTDEIVSVMEQETRAGEPAFEGFNPRRIQGAYSFGAALSVGTSEDELKDWVRRSVEQYTSAPVGATMTVGTWEVAGYVHVYEQIHDLIGTLQDNGIDTWIVSASAQPIVEVWGEEVGIQADRAIGVRFIHDEDGLQTPDLYGCGDVADGENTVMTYIEGKRCWANEVIFGIDGAAAFEQQPEELRPIFGAGDTVTDITFLLDSTKGKLVINRNNTEVMCHALDNQDGTWIINPMFIEPRDVREDPYPCSTSGQVDEEGNDGPVTRLDGTVIEDQVEAVG